MDGGATSRSDAGQNSDDWTEAEPATRRDLERSRRVLERITRELQAHGLLNSGDAEVIRAKVYRHLSIIASILKPVSNNVRAHPPRSVEQVEEVELAIRPIIADIVGLFGIEQNIVYFVDDDEAYTNAEQFKQLGALQENLSATIADYLDVVEGIDRGGARRSKVRRDFMAAFRQLQSKVDLMLGELQAWRR